MSDQLIEALTATHNDTWPLQIGHGSLINEDGPEAAAEITLLRAEVARLQPSTLKIDHLRKQLDRAESEIDALRSLLGEVRDRLDVIATADVYGNDKEGLQDMIVDIRCSARALIARIGEGET